MTCPSATAGSKASVLGYQYFSYATMWRRAFRARHQIYVGPRDLAVDLSRSDGRLYPPSSVAFSCRRLELSISSADRSCPHLLQGQMGAGHSLSLGFRREKRIPSRIGGKISFRREVQESMELDKRASMARERGRVGWRLLRLERKRSEIWGRNVDPKP